MISTWPQCLPGPIERLSGLVVCVAEGQASKPQQRQFRDLCEYLDLYVAASERHRAKQYAALGSYLGTGNVSQAAKLADLPRWTVRGWIDRFLLNAAENLHHLARYREAKRRDAKLRAASDTARQAFRDFLDSYCQFNHPPSGTGRTIAVDPGAYRATSCPACAARRGLFGRPGWGG